MQNKINHVGVAVRNLEDALNFFQIAFGFEPTKKVRSSKMQAAFIQIGKTDLELIEPIHPESFIAKFIAEKGEGLHHISLQVTNIETTLQMLEKKGITALDKEPKIGLHGTKITFLNPEHTMGILIELCEKPTTSHKIHDEDTEIHDL